MHRVVKMLTTESTFPEWDNAAPLVSRHPVVLVMINRLSRVEVKQLLLKNLLHETNINIFINVRRLKQVFFSIGSDGKNNRLLWILYFVKIVAPSLHGGFLFGVCVYVRVGFILQCEINTTCKKKCGQRLLIDE